MAKKAKIKIRELKPKIKEIKNEEETLEGDVEHAEEEIFQDLDSTRVEPGDADSLGASQARVHLSDIADSFTGRQSQASNPNEEMTTAQLYHAGFGLGDSSARVSYNPNAVSSSNPTLMRRDVGDFSMSQQSSMPENSMLDQTSARLRHQDVGDQEDKYSSTDLDKQSSGKRDRYWV